MTGAFRLTFGLDFVRHLWCAVLAREVRASRAAQAILRCLISGSLGRFQRRFQLSFFIAAAFIQEYFVVGFGRRLLLDLLVNQNVGRGAREEVQVNSAVDERRWLTGQLMGLRNSFHVENVMSFGGFLELVVREVIVEHKFRGLECRR